MYIVYIIYIIGVCSVITNKIRTIQQQNYVYIEKNSYSSKQWMLK